VEFPEFRRLLGSLFEDFIIEKMALGNRFMAGSQILIRFDRFLAAKGLETPTLPRFLVEEWLKRREYESAKTQRKRFNLTRQFAEHLALRGYDVHIPDSTHQPIVRDDFAPYIFSYEEIRQFFIAVDQLPSTARSPYRHIIIPQLFRLLYGCGLRIGEAVRLTRSDVDLKRGILTIRNSKFGKSRLVPMAPTLTVRLKRMLGQLDRMTSQTHVFPGRCDGHIIRDTVYLIFRDTLWKIGISHRGRSKGPCLHDLRHTFACHRLAKWYREGDDLSAKLPVLAAYMGHKTFFGTQRYLHLRLDLGVDLTKRLDQLHGFIIPKEVDS
ncbi:MAG: tyrosine-type recombinase/integrase, partial [Bacteroidetes bacterium]|nr:tyrosine-type recombinase/integrase [Bacteroidota bacterium]